MLYQTQSLIATARQLYSIEPFGLDLKETVYAPDATTIDLYLSVFPWAPIRTTIAEIKLYAFLVLRGNITPFNFISDGKLNEVNVLDQLSPKPVPSLSRLRAPGPIHQGHRQTYEPDLRPNGCIHWL